MRENTQSRQSRLTLAVRQNSGNIFPSPVLLSKATSDGRLSVNIQIISVGCL